MENAQKIFEDLYYLRDGQGNFIENTPEDVYNRIAGFFYEDGDKRKVLYELLASKTFMFNSPVLFNAGTKSPLLLACFIGDLQDSLDSIMIEALRCARIFKYGSGFGLNIGALRPKLDILNTQGYSSGPISFLQVFNTLGEVIKSGGKRRAAFMGMMPVNHPDIFNFIHCKEDGKSLENMNISIAALNNFMEAVISNTNYNLSFGDKIYKEIKATDLFQELCEAAWKSGCPGIYFIDEANAWNPVIKYGKIENANACAEVGTPPNTSCNLASIKLTNFYNQKTNTFDFNEYSDTVETVTEYLDRVIDLSIYPDEKIEKGTKDIRPLGLGFTDFSSLLFKMKIPYASERARSLAKTIMEITTLAAYKKSVQLAKDNGTFNVYEQCKEDVIIILNKYAAKSIANKNKWLNLIKDVEKYGLRNAFVTCLAPTGSISLIMDAFTYAAEPVFSLAYEKKLVNDGTILKYYNPDLIDTMKNINIYSIELLDVIEKRGGSIRGLNEFSDELQQIFITAHEIPVPDRILMQAALQEFCTMSISSTINFPNTATVEDVKSVYLLAWRNKCKGVTIYRDGSRDLQPMKTVNTKKLVIKNRPKEIQGKIIKCATPDGNIFVTLGFDEGKLIETFINLRHESPAVVDLCCALGRTLSLLLFSNVSIEQIFNSINGIGSLSIWDKLKDTDEKPTRIKSIPDAIAKIIFASYMEEPEKEKDTYINGFSECPSCHRTTFAKLEGCWKCIRCGYSGQCS